MSSRYDNPRRERNLDVRVQTARDDDDQEAGRRVRQDVRDTGRDIREAGGNIVGNVCSFWGNLLNGLSEAISPPSRSTRSRQESGCFDDESEEGRGGFFSCNGGEFRISCSSPRGGGRAERADDRATDQEERTTARYADRDREIDVTT